MEADVGMGTKITWAHATFNGVRGCQKISDGCKFCYAESDANSKKANDVLGYWGPEGPRVVGTDKYWSEPVAWNKKAKAEGKRLRVFAFSYADVFEQYTGPMVDTAGRRLYVTPNNLWVTKQAGAETSKWRPLTYDDCRERLFALINATPHLDWLLLTKRAADVMTTLRRMERGATYEKDLVGNVLAGAWADGMPPENVWLGVSVEDQKHAWLRIEHLRGIPAKVRWLSVEPQLGEVDLSPWLGLGAPMSNLGRPFHWVVVGGESEEPAKARPFRLEWARKLLTQCRDHGVAFFMKQLGTNCYRAADLSDFAEDVKLPLVIPHSAPAAPVRIDGAEVLQLRLRHRKGEDLAEWPADLRVQEFPDA